MVKNTKNLKPMFWSPYDTLTHNALYNFIIGNRGGGKTFGGKMLGIDRFIKKHEQFGYIRRFKSDISKSVATFFDDIIKLDIYPDWEFKSDGNKFYGRIKSDKETPWTDGDIMGYAFTLSTADNQKSVSFPNITLLLFDEFLLVKGSQHYLPSEPIKLLSLYETIARPGTGHKDVILLCLANNVSITNPYFLFFDLKMPTKQDKHGKWIWKPNNGRSILVEDVRSEDYIEMKKSTKFGEIISGTKYEDYSVNNKALVDTDTFVMKKTGNSRYWFTFIYGGCEYGVWYDYGEGIMFVSNDVDKSCPIVYSTTSSDHRPNAIFIRLKNKNVRFKTFIEAYKMGSVYFESINLKNITYEVIKMYMSI